MGMQSFAPGLNTVVMRAGWLFACVLTGVIVVFFSGLADNNPVRLVALPAALALVFFLVFDKGSLFLLLVALRAPIDPLLESTRIAPFLGLGAVFNALIILIAILHFAERPRPFVRVVVPMWLPLILIMGFATARAPDRAEGVRTFLVYLTYAAVFAVPLCLKQCRENLRFCMYVVLASSVIPAMYGAVDFAQFGCGRADYRICSTFNHPNIFAFYLVLVISLAFCLLKSDSLKNRLGGRFALGIYIAYLVVLLVLTKTRSAWAAAFFVFALYGLMFERRYLVYIALACLLALLVPDVRDRLLELDTSVQVLSEMPHNSYEWRTLMWQSAWDWMPLSSLPLGNGLNSFQYYSIIFFPYAYGVNHGAHSVYVQWLFEAGIAGVLCAAWLFYRLFAFLLKGFRHDRLGMAIVITIFIEYLIVSYADNMLGYLSFNWYFWFVMGSACAVILARNDAARDAEAARAVGHTPTGGTA